MMALERLKVEDCTNRKGSMMKNPGFRRWGVLALTAVIATSLLGQTANAQGLLWPIFHPHGSYTRTTSSGGFLAPSGNMTFVPIQSAQMGSVSSTSVNGLNLIPISNVATAGVSAGQTFHILQTPANSVAVGSVGSSQPYYIVRGAQAQSNVMFIPTNAPAAGVGSAAATSAGASSVDNDYAVLSAGFGNRFSKIPELEQTLKDALAGLQGKNLGSSQITTLLKDAAQTYLSNSQFGIAFDLVEPIVERMIGRLLKQNGGPLTPNPLGPKQTDQSQTGNLNGQLLSGSQTFTITGTVTLGTPTGQKPAQNGTNSLPNTTLPAIQSIDNTQPASPPAN
jgi:hypothetical protein